MEEETEKKKGKIMGKIKKNPWIFVTITLAIITLILLISNFSGLITGKTISKKEAGEMLLNFYEQSGVQGLKLVSVDEVSGLYQVVFEYEGNLVPIYISKDGNLMGPLSALPDSASSTDSGSQYQSSIPKSDKPKVELFVMSYCPYGTQAEKGIIPAVKTLGNSIDFKIRFVYYAMHGEKEVTENLREYCIQKIAPNKFLDYMTCFLEGDGVIDETYGLIMNGNDVDYCLAQVGIDTDALENCMAEADKEYSVTENLEDESSWLSGYYPLFDVDKELNEKYGVGGSPTLVINGNIVSSGRDPASYLDIICQAFTDAPEECSEVLSSDVPNAYFGWGGTGSSTSAQCA